MDLLADFEARGLVQDSTDRDALRDRLAAGPVGIYYGCDPSNDSLQVGNLIGLLVLRRFAETGHNAIALAGGATGMIGDPGGRSKERNLLDAETLRRNTKRIADQLERISGVSLVNNLGWTGSLTLLDFLRDIGKHASVNQMIARESVKARLESDNGISFTEFSYQLLQANDYLHLFRNYGVEIQIGGSDQWGNLLAGVDLIRKADGQHVHAFTWPLLLRSDGKKFGKSEDGAVWLAADRTSPYQFFQYWMNVADADVERFLLQLTLLPVAECRTVAAAHALAPSTRAGQRRLAREVTTIVHGAAATSAAEEASAILFGRSPAGASAQALSFLASEVPTSPFVPGDDLAHALVATPLASSLSDARRTIAQGAAYVNGELVREDRPLSEADLLHDRWLLLRRGKRTYHLLDVASRLPGRPTSDRRRSSMSFEKTPAGTRGASMPGASSPVAKWIGNQMIKRARRKGGTNTLVLTTIGAKTGQRRETLLGSFPDGDNAWLIIASFGGNAKNPAWYHNLAAHPDQVEIEVGGRKVKVTATQLSGAEREAAWDRVVAAQPRYAGYVKKTDRVIPVIRLVAA